MDIIAFKDIVIEIIAKIVKYSTTYLLLLEIL